MPRVGWLDSEDVAQEWLDAPEEPALSELLEIAHDVCAAYAPAPVPGRETPARYRMAQLLQAKHLYARSKAGNADSIGPDGYAISTYPLVLEARTLLRPPTRRGGVF